MNQLTESDIMGLLGPTTVPAGISNGTKEQQQNSDDPIPSNWPFDTSTIGNLNGKDEVITEKMAALEAKNRFLEGKLACMETKAKGQENNVETKFAIVKNNNEELAKIIGNFKDELNEEYQRKMDELKDEFGKLLFKQGEEHQKQLEELKVNNKAYEEKVRNAEKTAQMANNQLKEIIHANQLKFAELAKEIGLLKKQQEPNQQALAEINRKLPAELERQIFLCLNPTTQRKFIWGLGWDFYAMFRHRLLIKTMRVSNPHGNRWDGTSTMATVAADGLSVSNRVGHPIVFAEQPFAISGPQCRVNEFPGTICYYYEVNGYLLYLGLSDDVFPVFAHRIGAYSNSYGMSTNFFHECLLSGESHHFELPEGAGRPRLNSGGTDVHGCGLLLDPEDKLAIFFTLNGNLMGEKIPITPTVDELFPTVTMLGEVTSFVANFGDDVAKSFEYDIQNCPGLGLACI